MFVISFFQLAIVMPKDQMVKHVMIMVYAVVKLILSMTNVMHVILAFLTFRHVKVCYMTLLQILVIQVFVKICINRKQKE